MIGLLVLEDGTVFQGKGFGYEGKKAGEVVFNTSMTGYQQILTDPSYCGQIVVMTYALIGNYGVNREDMEAVRSYANGFVVHQLCTEPNNWRAYGKLEEFLIDQQVIGLQGVDTRALTLHLRRHGTLRGIVAAGDYSPGELLLQLHNLAPGENCPVAKVSTAKPYVLPGGPLKMVVMDFGVKQNILRWFQKNGCKLIVVPFDAPAEQIMDYRPDGIILSNGPGDPENIRHVTKTVSAVLEKVPVLGVCLGHQLLGLTLGGKTYKLPFGHRGGNHPVKDLKTGRVFMTAQNHGYALEANSLPGDETEISHISLFDGTVEGIRHRKLPVFSVQFHPEGAPGPQDSEYIFRQFLDAVRLRRAIQQVAG